MENQNNLTLNDLAVDSLRESAKWTMFLSIVGFIFIGLMFIGGAVTIVSLSNIPDEPEFGGMNPFGAVKNFIGIIYLVMAAIYFFPVLYLYKYSKGVKEAINFSNSEVLADALQNLKSHYKFVGILTIVLLCLYALAFIGIIIFAASMASGAM
ncbi:DUF5362 family protein [Flavobacterium buctense]|uniref:DUF5362 family protein n=1 Tax=Flavobacterium buctense TaxID=1648146 RepID=A0ABU9DZQ8_9FLAO|nr:DUF5362 family protein [Flavobacterium buctense]